MGLFDLPAPLFAAVDGMLGSVLPSLVRLLLWGVLAGWLTMVLYRRLSNQEKIGVLKASQKEKQKQIAEFDGEMEDLLPLIGATLKLGFRQLGLAIGPALLATIPILFLVALVAGAYGYLEPEPGDTVTVTTSPSGSMLTWKPAAAALRTREGWNLIWPAADSGTEMLAGGETLLELPTPSAVPIIHKREWWNALFGNPIGYLPDDSAVDEVHIGLPAQEFLSFGPAWLRGWMFSFFMIFLLASVAFKFLLKID